MCRDCLLSLLGAGNSFNERPWRIGKRAMSGAMTMLRFRQPKWTPLDARRKIFMRKRYQEQSIKKYRGAWIAQWWEDGHSRNRTIGRVNDYQNRSPGAACFDCDTPQYQAVVGVEESHAQRVCEAGLCPRSTVENGNFRRLTELLNFKYS